MKFLPVAAVVVALCLTGAVQAQGPRNTVPYPADYRAGFMAGCTESGKVSEAVCACMYRGIERTLSPAEAEELDEAMEAGQGDDHPLMKLLEPVLMACVKDPNA